MRNKVGNKIKILITHEKIDPYTYVFNTPVMSANGERPVWYQGYHQSDVIRAKA